MILIPAIDIKNGKCVRLLQGDFEKETIYENSPVQQAEIWQEKGAELIHIVDLDGAKKGISSNLKIIEEIKKKINVPIELGGGIRTLDDVKKIVDIGVDYLILGTSVIRDFDLLEKVVSKYGERIVVGIDALNNKVAISGWVENTDIDAIELGQKVKKIGVKRIIYTDISRDGMLSSPNFEALKVMAEGTNCEITASGGISTYNDLETLKKMEQFGITGAITGKALYDKKIELEKAIEILK